jgi:hypothetical protein
VELGEDDRAAAAARLDMRDLRLGGVPRPGQVGGNHVLPGLLFEVGALAVADDPGIRRHDIEPTALGHARVKRGLDRTEVPHISVSGHDPASSASTSFVVSARSSGVANSYGTESIGAQMSIAMISALLRQSNRVAATLTSCRAGDERDLAFQSSRRLFSLVS